MGRVLLRTELAKSSIPVLDLWSRQGILPGSMREADQEYRLGLQVSPVFPESTREPAHQDLD
jgi:hypothetical protein